MFSPPRCPNRSCRNFDRPSPGFWIRYGSYHPRCRPRPVPRFRCRCCRRTFSRQTFRMDYRDHKPHLNIRLFELIASGVGLRQSSRKLGLSRHCTEMKFRKIGRHLRHLNRNTVRPTKLPRSFVFDEFETFEGRRNTRPLSIPTLVERESYFVVWAESAPIRARGKMTEGRRAAIRADDLRFGRRRDRSFRACVRTVRRARAISCAGSVMIDTDQKHMYPPAIGVALSDLRVDHRQTSGRLARGTWNPLFPINATEALMRDLLGRLRRRSWLVSKRGWCLNLALHILAADRNFVRKRFNRDPAGCTPARVLGLFPRQLRPGELLAWRQDWRLRSPLTIGNGRKTVEAWKAAD